MEAPYADPRLFMLAKTSDDLTQMTLLFFGFLILETLLS
jgi:hypothetical protein